MKIKTLPNNFTRARFKWEVLERKTFQVGLSEDAKVYTWGLFKQDDRFVVARIIQRNPNPYGDENEFDKIEHVAPDSSWGISAKTYLTLKEAREEYDKK